MKIAINNTDYSAALDGVRPLEMVRKLNEPSTCRMWLTLPGNGSLATPLRNWPLAVTGDDGTAYFTGYLAVSPLPEFAGLGLAGPVYRLELQAVSDEILLDTQLIPPSAGTTGVTVGALVAGLVTKTGSSALRTTGLTLATTVSQFVPEAGAKWSALAGQASALGRAAYRALNGTLVLGEVGTTVHALSEANGTLELSALALTAAVDRALANDVTVCGAEEPVAYVTEYFLGDGTTLAFPLSESPFFGPTAAAKIIWEQWQEGSIDLQLWRFSGNSMYFSITTAGLTMNGGNGIDGEAALVWNDGVEAGGTLLLEAVGVQLAPGSTGLVAALFSSTLPESMNCVAGFQATAATGTGVVSVAPFVQGAVAGASYTLNAANQYTLRIRVHCPEVERITQAYRVAGDAGLLEFGGNGLAAQGWVRMDLQEFVEGVAGTPVVLYDGAVGYLAGTFTVAAASSLNLIGTMRSLYMKGLGTQWVSTVPSGGAMTGASTAPVGTLADGSICHMTRAGAGPGSLTFYSGYAPAAGTIVAAQYRSKGRAVGRAVNAASQAVLAALGDPPAAVWIGTVTEPKGRSSLDCRNAAAALMTAASSVSAAWSGSYKTTNVALNAGSGLGGSGTTGPTDVWPGDALLLESASYPGTAGGLNVQVVVRAVTVQYAASVPDLVQYTIAFSNDWANDLSVKTSHTVPGDAWLPAVVSPAYLADVTGLTVTAITPVAVSVTTGVTAPSGGGFEVRRRDFAFAPGQDPDLVIRSVVSSFDIPRATEADRFYVRMYDGSTPPNYSEFSVGLFLNLPLSV